MWRRPAGGPKRRPFARLRLSCSLMTAAALALAVGACGSGSGGEAQGRPPDYQRALAGASPPLASLYRQANRLLPGGVDAFDARLSGLRGHPVVVNKWASWCGPCHEEFPWFQDLSARLGKRVAFLGVDSNDSSAAARTFLREFPVPYPSYSDPGQEIARAIRATDCACGLATRCRSTVKSWKVIPVWTNRS